jgi:hypothetical protein
MWLHLSQPPVLRFAYQESFVLADQYRGYDAQGYTNQNRCRAVKIGIAETIGEIYADKGGRQADQRRCILEQYSQQGRVVISFPPRLVLQC